MFICSISIFNKFGKHMLDEMLAPMNLDWRQLIVILVLDRVPGMTQKRLVPFLQTDKGNVTKLLQLMETKDLIIRKENPDDHRNRICFLTSGGNNLVPLLIETMKAWEKKCFRGISEEDLEKFNQVSEAVNRNMMESS